MSSGERKISFLGDAPHQMALAMGEDGDAAEGQRLNGGADRAPPASAASPGSPAEAAPTHEAPLLVQLAELEAGAAEWREAARWIKYEEDVEEEAGRWGRPHVASLAYRALLELRHCLQAGAVLLDAADGDLLAVADRVSRALLHQRHERHAPELLRALLLPHRRLPEDRPFRFSLTSQHRASHASLQSLWAARARVRAGGGSLQEGGETPETPASPATPATPAPRRHSALPRVNLQALRSLGEGRRRRNSGARKKSSVAGLEGRELERLAEGEEDTGSGRGVLARRAGPGAEAAAVLVGELEGLEGLGAGSEGSGGLGASAFVRLAGRGVHAPGLTGTALPLRFLFVLVGGEGDEVGGTAQLERREVGRALGALLAQPAFRVAASRATSRRELIAALDTYLEDSIVLPPSDWQRADLLPLPDLRARSDLIRRRKSEAPPAHPAPPAPPLDEKQALLLAESAAPVPEPDEPLARTGRPFGGVVRDMRRRYPHYRSDFTDALNGQCAAAAIFMYFAALSSAITFGGLLAEKTQGQIGISETLVFTCVGGVVFALGSGQPMMITGATGPLLLLDESLASVCRAYGFDFLTARMYAGLWMVVIALAVAALEGSVAVKKITRFTEDIFAFLISLIFISEPITATLGVYRAHPLGADYCANGTDSFNNGTDSFINGTDSFINGTDSFETGVAETGPRPNTALWCTMLTLATFTVAYYLRIFRNGKFLGRSARRALGDFGVPIAIVSMVGMAALVPVWTETLRVPEGLRPTAPRPWLVPLGAGLSTVPVAGVAAMVLPALMVYIIVFMETHIAELIVDKPERRLRKGSGLHLDIVLVSLVNALSGLFGAPWQCVATVRSVSHVAALTVMSGSQASAPGEKPHIVEVKEQRLTGLLVALLVGASVLAARWLRLVPMSVLFGVFLYMGVSALAGIQLWDRLVLLLKPVKHHPPVPYVSRVPTRRMHLYTLVQAAGLVLLYAVKSSRFSLALPFFLVLMVPLRMALGRCFTPLQLRALDGAQREIDEDDEPDFYKEAPLPG